LLLAVAVLAGTGPACDLVLALVAELLAEELAVDWFRRDWEPVRAV
jgi:hypothetical protein